MCSIGVFYGHTASRRCAVDFFALLTNIIECLSCLLTHMLMFMNMWGLTRSATLGKNTRLFQS